MNSTLQALSIEKDMLGVAIASWNDLLRNLLNAPAVGPYLLPHLKPVMLERNEVLYEQGDSIDVVYLPLDAVISDVVITEDGMTIETAMIGREGVVGISSILGTGKSRQWTWVSISGTAVQLDARILERVFVQNEAALKSLLKCYRALISQVSQRCVCNTKHSVLQRLSCWLLMVHDRAEGNLRLTQETIATRLGARRAGITVAAGVLQDMQGIEYRRGQFHIVDRSVLEQMVCECYTTMRASFGGFPAGSSL